MKMYFTQPMACVSFLLIKSVMGRRCVRICVPFPGYRRSHQTEAQFCFNVLLIWLSNSLHVPDKMFQCFITICCFFSNCKLVMFYHLLGLPAHILSGHQTNQNVVLYRQQLWFSLTLDAEAPGNFRQWLQYSYFPLHPRAESQLVN